MAGHDAAGVARLERLYATPQIVEQRRRFRAAVAAQPGERGVDIGCGAGHLSCELAREVGASGRIVAIDPSPDALAACRARAEGEGVSGLIDVQQGDAEKLGLADESFDFAVAVQVYCFVAEIGAALREARRVLRKGGRLVILDSDWEFCAYRSADPALTRRLIDCRAESMYAHAYLPRRLPELLHAAGFRLCDVGVFALVETRYDPESFGAGTVPSLREAGRRKGIPERELAAWEADLRSRTAEGQWFFCLNRFLFHAERP